MPPLAVVYFKGPCPSGWTEDTGSQGRVVVGLPSGGVLSATVGTALTDAQDKSANLTHSGTAVADHASHTHSVTSNVAVADHAAHTHSVTSNVTAADHTVNQVINHTHAVTVTDPGHVHNQRSQTATTGSVSSWEHGVIDTSSTAAETLPTDSATTGITATTANPAGGVASITLQHTLTNNAVTSGNPSATLTHAVTNNAVTSAGPSATLTHTVTQPSTHTLKLSDFLATVQYRPCVKD